MTSACNLIYSANIHSTQQSHDFPIACGSLTSSGAISGTALSATSINDTGALTALTGVFTNGATSPATTGGFRLTSFTGTPSGSSPQTLNDVCGYVQFTGLASVLAGNRVTVTINNSQVTGTTRVTGNIVLQNVAAGSCLVVYSVTQGSGVINYSLMNPTGTATGAAGEVTVYYQIVG